MADKKQTRLVPHIATSTTGSKRVSKAMTVGPEEIPTCLDHSWIWLVSQTSLKYIFLTWESSCMMNT